MTNRLDIVIFGATGFTGKYVLIQAHKLFKNVTWGIAGRNESKLKQILYETAKSSGIHNIENIPVISANCDDEKTIKEMTRQAKIIINCCGPFELFGGDVVVKCCIETGTHYIDISAEELFIKSLILKYRKCAEEKGVYIVNLCGFDSVPFDLGVCFIEKKFEGTLNSMEIYLHSSSSCTGSSLNYTTWTSIVNTLAKYKKLKSMKKQFKEEKAVELKPKLTTKLPHRVEQGLAVPYPGGDEETVCRSQQYFYENNNKRPIQVRNYLIFDSFYTVAITIIFGVLCYVLAQFSFGRSILLKYPEFFSHGTFSHDSPTEDTIDKRHFSLTFKGKGWSNKQKNNRSQHQTTPDKEILGIVSGNNPAYGFTALAVVLSALTTLLEPQNLPTRGGIYTPAAAFHKTSLTQRLQDNGVNFQVISVTDI